MKARQSDVAREAGVSPRTVSNVINGYPHIKPETVARVQAAIKKLNYIPNRSARTLRTGKIGIIGLAVPELTLPYFADLATKITTAAEARGYTILIDITEGKADRERLIAGGLRPHAIDGLILSPLRLRAREVDDASDGTPLVLLGEWSEPSSNHAYVGVDNIAAAGAATQHLIELGRRRIAAIGTVPGREGGTASQRFEGYRRAVTAAGLPVRQESVLKFNRMQGEAAMERLLDDDLRPDAVFCFNDLVAVGALATLRRRGLSVPGDVALIGWDDIREVAYSWPPISSIRADSDQIAAIAVDMIIDQLAGVRPAELHRTVGYSLIARESTVGPTPS
ncbi:LacI family DNA-binding transcriptional regulator [Microlunatus parietis]|uniref:DNA-binding LacI/PurR family transcriptional regulator n=1 Tax=Microlunatus parietis TaxID=682979 RepID=A0A7Y9IED3_9ACTN|nr:LacI family DNA-binding transcriptional regulator [Microlunatus parietis]NYE75327.1 DNA-binding LacI/PurR family transcriptional regulator [Microlunatus parietis]